MGARGQAPTPTAILKARGSWRAKVREQEPQLPVCAPDCPDRLQGEARAEWFRVSVELVAMRVLTKADRAALVLWCEAWAEYVRVQESLEGKKPWGKGMSRLVWIRKGAVDTLLKLAAQFGFTPSARARLQTSAAEPEENDKSRFFKGAS